MTGNIVASRYGGALFALAKEKEQLGPWSEQLQEIAAVFSSHQDLQELLRSGMIERQQKKAVLNALFAQKIDDEVLHFLFLLLDKGRQMELPEIVRVYQKRVDDYNGIKMAHVTSAVPLLPEEAQRLQSALGKRLSCHIQLDVEVDPSILGGLKVQVGDTVYDGSLSHQLERMGRQLVK